MKLFVNLSILFATVLLLTNNYLLVESACPPDPGIYPNSVNSRPFFGIDGNAYFIPIESSGTFQHPLSIDGFDFIHNSRPVGGSYPVVANFPSVTLTTPAYVDLQFACNVTSNANCNRLYIPVRYDDSAQISFGIACYDIGTRAPCTNGFNLISPITNYPGGAGGNPYISGHMPEYNGKIYYVTPELILYCFDLVTDDFCTTPFSTSVDLKAVPGSNLRTINFDGNVYNIGAKILTINNIPQLYVAVGYGATYSNFGGRLYCYSFLSGTACPGFTTGAVPFGGPTLYYFSDLAITFDSSGNANGICMISGATKVCLRPDGTLPTTPPGDLNAVPTVTSSLWNIDNRHYYFTANDDNVYCINFANGARCAGFPLSRAGAPLRLKGASFDPNKECIFVNGDDHEMWSFDESGNVPCGAGSVDAVLDIDVQTSGGTFTVDAVANDINADPTTVTVVSTNPVGIVTSVNPVTGAITYTAAQEQHDVVINYRVCARGYKRASDTANIVARLCNDTLDTDLDGVNNCRDYDIDNDGIINFFDGDTDWDGDGIPNFRDTDSDNDGIPDLIEALGRICESPFFLHYCALTASGSGPDSIDTDLDGIVDGGVDVHGIPINIEYIAVYPSLIGVLPNNIFGRDIYPLPDSDGDGYYDTRDIDSDNDGLYDLAEGAAPGSIFTDLDADNDGRLDSTFAGPYVVSDFDDDTYPDYLDVDSDNDGIFDLHEGTVSGFSNYDLDHEPSNGADDGDGVIDQVFILNGHLDDQSLQDTITYPDTDSDTNEDFRDLDSDDDAILDIYEAADLTQSNGYDDVQANLYDNVFTSSLFVSNSFITNGRLSPSLQLIIHENSYDQDGDEVPNQRDLDSDNDSILDLEESFGSPFVADDNDLDGVLDPSSNFELTHSHLILNSDNDRVVDFLDLDSDNDATGDSIEAGTFITASDFYTPPDSDGDGIMDVVDSNGFSFGGPSAARYLPDSDQDGFPDYIDLYSRGISGRPDYISKSNQPPSIGLDAITNPIDDDYDGIEDTYYDEQPGIFGGLAVHAFVIKSPDLHATWKMYKRVNIQWRHNITIGYDRIKIYAKSKLNGDIRIVDKYPIGQPNFAVNSYSFTPSVSYPDCIAISFSVYLEGESDVSVPDLHVSPYFPLITGSSPTHCTGPGKLH